MPLSFNVNPGLKETRGLGHQRLGKVLVIAQLAVSMILVVGATLFLQTLVNLHSVDHGFKADDVIVVSVRSSRPYDAARGYAVQRAIVERLRGVPEIVSASAAQILPIGGGLWNRTVQVEGYTFGPGESDSIGFNVIAPDYFQTIGTPLILGREFIDRDTGASPKVAIVNEGFARRFFGDAPPLGRRVTSNSTTYEIVGVVRDAAVPGTCASRSWKPCTSSGFRRGWGPADPVQLPGARRHAGSHARDARSRAPHSRGRPITAPAGHAHVASTLVDRSIASERIMAMLGGFFGVLALVVAAIGLFGLLAFQVSRRTE